jgi:V-type ATPase 116kDa subunit family
MTKFERMVFRITKGKAILNNENFSKYLMDQLRAKNPVKFSTDKSAVFIVFPISGESNYLGSKLINICQTFEVNIVGIPKQKTEIDKLLTMYEQQLVELTELNNQTKNLILDKLQDLGKSKKGYKCSYIE